MAKSIHSTTHLDSEQTGGRYSLVENTVAPGFGGPPLHHHDFDEGFYVLDGELTFQLGDEYVLAGPGAFLFAPRGAVHTFANHSDEPGRYLLLIAPAGFETYFERLSRRAAGEDVPEPEVKAYPPTEVVGGQIPADAVTARRLP
jgi:quercetin dioxygenase-like cupin family protein